MKHNLWPVGQNIPEAPSQIKDRNGVVVLQLCKLCGRAESELDQGCINYVDWRKHPRQFHCHCDRCQSQCGPITRKRGKFWQRKYGERPTAFRHRYLEAHRR